MGDPQASLFLPFGTWQVDAQECGPFVRATILKGGSAQYFDGTYTRVLDAGLAEVYKLSGSILGR